MKYHPHRLHSIILLWAGTCLTVMVNTPACAQNNERWFQVEISVFSNEDALDRASEVWTPAPEPLAYPPAMQRVQSLLDLLITDELTAPAADVAPAQPPADNMGQQSITDYIASTGPYPAQAAGDFRFFDLARDAFIQLPDSASDFQQTNRALQRSADHRLLYHGLWRQPVRGTADATPLYINGGTRYGDEQELQGSISIHFNTNADRVVIDADLWLGEFSVVAGERSDWQLPAVPAGMRRVYDPGTNANEPDYHIQRIYRLHQSRDMRSTEFHYLDHPALGVIVMVKPYEVPPVPTPNPDIETAQ